MSVTGVQSVIVKGRVNCRHQVFVAGANADYVVTVIMKDSDGVDHERSPANNTINGLSGLPIIISGRFHTIKITPPDGAAYTYEVRQLDS